MYGNKLSGQQIKHIPGKMMGKKNKDMELSFAVDRANLYREESYTDLKVASIRKLIPIKVDGSDDKDRLPVFIGHAELISPQGPIPVQAPLKATSLDAAITELPVAMEKVALEVRDNYLKMQEQQQQQQSIKSNLEK
jgi:hypothetical protein